MVSDLVSGVLTRLAELEAEHHRAADELREAARLKVGAQFGDYILGTIADGLRLCRAHRQIVERHMPMNLTTDPAGWRCQTCGFEAGKWPVSWPCDTFMDLAVGLGVVEEEDRNGD